MEKYVIPLVISVLANFIFLYLLGVKKKYFRKKVESLKEEKKLIGLYSKSPIELVRDSFRIVFYLFFLMALANLIRLFHGLLYDDGVSWQQVFVEGGVWVVIVLISLQYHRVISSLNSKEEAISKIEDGIEAASKKISSN